MAVRPLIIMPVREGGTVGTNSTEGYPVVFSHWSISHLRNPSSEKIITQFCGYGCLFTYEMQSNEYNASRLQVDTGHNTLGTQHMDGLAAEGSSPWNT